MFVFVGFRAIVCRAVVTIILNLSQCDLAYDYVRYINHVPQNMFIV